MASSAIDNTTRIIHTPIISSDDCIISLYENVLNPQEASEWLRELSKSLPWATETDNFGLQSRPTCYFGDDENCIFSYVGLRLVPKPWPESLQILRSKVAQAYHNCNHLNSQTQQQELNQEQDETNINTNTITKQQQLQKEAEEKKYEEEILLTACLANLYSDSSNHIPWHYDEVRAHGKRKIVASLSLGGPRRFLIRKRGDTEILANLLLPSGSVLWMEGKTQEVYEHCLPPPPTRTTSTTTQEEEQKEASRNDNGNSDNNITKDTDQDGALRVSLTFRSIVPGYEKNREIAVDVCCT